MIFAFLDRTGPGLSSFKNLYLMIKLVLLQMSSALMIQSRVISYVFDRFESVLDSFIRF